DRRQEVVERIKIARGCGDLYGKSEYDAGKDEQADGETRIAQVEKMIGNSVSIESDDQNQYVVTSGMYVTLKEIPDRDEETHILVGSAEADPYEGKISNDSPMATSLLGQKIGTEVNVSTPGGEMQVKIMHVE